MVFHRVEQAMQIQEQNLLYIISLLLVDICPGVGLWILSGIPHLSVRNSTPDFFPQNEISVCDKPPP